MDWKTFGLDLNDTKTYIERSKFEILTVEDLVFPPSENEFGFLKLALPCLRIDCMNDIRRLLIESLKFENNKELQFHNPSTFKIKDNDTGIERRLDNNEILERLTNFEKEEINGDLIDFPHCKVIKPMNLALEVLPIPSKKVRPSKFIEYESHDLGNPSKEDSVEMIEDDLTHKLVDIIRINQRLIENIDAGAPELIIEDLWELLQYHITTYIDNQTEGIPPARHFTGRKLVTIAQKLVGTKKDNSFKEKWGKFKDYSKKFKINFDEEWS